MESSLPVEAVFFYEGTVVRAEDNGVLRAISQAGYLMFAGTVCAAAEDGTSRNYKVSDSGMVLYETDGCATLPFLNDLSKVDGDALWQRTHHNKLETFVLTGA